ncbi:MAG: hypothetical protein N3A38_16005, partial [Planctomycetota bacterium]|nr:hypothetical protein [Planctomycetota bacterium]
MCIRDRRKEGLGMPGTFRGRSGQRATGDISDDPPAMSGDPTRWRPRILRRLRLAAAALASPALCFAACRCAAGEADLASRVKACRVKLDFQNADVPAFVAKLAADSRLPFVIDEEGIAADRPFESLDKTSRMFHLAGFQSGEAPTCMVEWVEGRPRITLQSQKEVPVEAVLEDVLGRLGLNWKPDGGRILITTEKRAPREIVTRTFVLRYAEGIPDETRGVYGVDSSYVQTVGEFVRRMEIRLKLENDLRYPFSITYSPNAKTVTLAGTPAQVNAVLREVDPASWDLPLPKQPRTQEQADEEFIAYVRLRAAEIPVKDTEKILKMLGDLASDDPARRRRVYVEARGMGRVACVLAGKALNSPDPELRERGLHLTRLIVENEALELAVGWAFADDPDAFLPEAACSRRCLAMNGGRPPARPVKPSDLIRTPSGILVSMRKDRAAVLIPYAGKAAERWSRGAAGNHPRLGRYFAIRLTFENGWKLETAGSWNAVLDRAFFGATAEPVEE